MNELPKSLRDELARQQTGALAHPDADLLTAFSEGTATPAERAMVEQHLALCGPCREVMFLAAPAEEAPSPAVARKPLGRTRWFPVWAPWAAAATVLIVATWTITRTEKESAVQFAKQNPVVAREESPALKTPPAAAPKAEAPLQEAAKPAATARMADGSLASLHAPQPELKAKDAYDTAAARRDQEVLEAKKDSGIFGGIGGAVPPAAVARSEAMPASAPAAQKTVAEDRMATTRNTSLKPGPAAPVQNQMAQNQGLRNQATQSEIAQNAPGAGLSGQAATMDKAQPMRSAARAKALPSIRWRISADGALQRQLAGADWTHIPLAPGTQFTVVATVGSSVWAGNDIGALYHSDDAGESWGLVHLRGLTMGPESRISAISFRDALDGVVTSANGNRWSTSDGGATWQRN